MAAEKLLAEWFWIDRWMGSSAFLLPMEARGLYREMLTQAWRRGAQLPNDHAAIRRATGATVGEWRRCWPKVKPYWTVRGALIVNDTQVIVYADALKRNNNAKTRAKAAAAARWSNAQALLKDSPLSPSPSLRRTNTRTAAKRTAVRPDIQDHKNCNHEQRCETRHACISRTLSEGRKSA